MKSSWELKAAVQPLVRNHKTFLISRARRCFNDLFPQTLTSSQNLFLRIAAGAYFPPFLGESGEGE